MSMVYITKCNIEGVYNNPKKYLYFLIISDYADGKKYKQYVGEQESSPITLLNKYDVWMYNTFFKDRAISSYDDDNFILK